MNIDFSRNVRLVELIKALNFAKDAEFARRIKISPTSLNHYKRHRREVLSTLAIQIRAEYKNFNIDWLLEGKGPMFFISDDKIYSEETVREISALKIEVNNLKLEITKLNNNFKAWIKNFKIIKKG